MRPLFAAAAGSLALLAPSLSVLAAPPPLTAALTMAPALPGAPAVSAAPAAPAIAAPAGGPEAEAYFQKKIVPILADNCFKCHSAAEKVKGGLALDTRAALLKGGEDGAILAPGKPAESHLLQRVTSTEKDEKMPPQGAALTPAEIADLTTWIRQGAAVPANYAAAAAKPNDRTAIRVIQDPGTRQHWAWQPVHAPDLPRVRNSAWTKTPVDLFILSKLEEKGVPPSPAASRPALIRRAYFDLIGLPPMPWEVQAFVDDKSPEAWEKVIDRLLASPRYGERWGRHWLDVARYSDTKGDTKRGDSPIFPDAWSYRDFVIDAFNRDLPYDQFIVQQLAADSLPLGGDKRPLAALGFLTLGDRFNGNNNDVINDRIDVVSKAFLGLTVACARCHDHMFDPITQKDYYALHGIFASTQEPRENPVITAQADAKLYQEYLQAREVVLTEGRQMMQGEMDRVRKVFRRNPSEFLQALSVQGGDRLPYLRALEITPKEAQEALGLITGRGAENAGPPFRQTPVFLPFFALAQIPQEKFAERAPTVLADVLRRGQRQGTINPQIAAMLKDKTPSSLEEVAGYYAEFFRTFDAAATASAGEHPVQLVSAAGPVPPVDGTAQEIRDAPFSGPRIQALLGPEAERYLPPIQAQRYQKITLALGKIDLTHPGAPRRAQSVQDAEKIVKSPVFIRGEAQNRGEMVPHRFLEILGGTSRPEFTKGSGRLELAEAIASKGNPLTARVMVNRVWLHHFGDGLVLTPDDFGTMAGAPSHPELLDYLSSRFMSSGWSVKALHKLIMLSAVYQQTSETNETSAALDPNNRLLWRDNIRRLDFEGVRDSLLYLAGKLDLKLGGQPVNILSEPYSLRRSVYGFIDRANLSEMMTHFDFANPAFAEGRRHETTVPQQALFMMNSPLVVDVARKLLARPEMAQAHDDAQRIHALYWMIYQRPPRTEELELGLHYLIATAQQDESVLPGEDPANKSSGNPNKRGKPARKPFAQPGRRGPIVLTNPGELVERKLLTPWENYTQALLMANETVYYN